MSNVFRQNRWKYYGHVLRMDHKQTAEGCAIWQTNGAKKKEETKNNPQKKKKQTNKQTNPLWSKTRAVSINGLKEPRHVEVYKERWRVLVPALCAMFGTGG